jgi:hypothetical protein
MATIALDKIASANPATTAPRRGILSMLRSAYDALVEAQEMRAKIYVNGYLAHLSDEELARHGMTRDQMIRRTRSMMASL